MIKTTGSPPSIGHPFSSLNPEAAEFVPGNFSTVLQLKQPPRPFPVASQVPNIIQSLPAPTHYQHDNPEDLHQYPATQPDFSNERIQPQQTEELPSEIRPNHQNSTSWQQEQYQQNTFPDKEIVNSGYHNESYRVPPFRKNFEENPHNRDPGRPEFFNVKSGDRGTTSRYQNENDKGSRPYEYNHSVEKGNDENSNDSETGCKDGQYQQRNENWRTGGTKNIDKSYKDHQPWNRVKYRDQSGPSQRFNQNSLDYAHQADRRTEKFGNNMFNNRGRGRGRFVRHQRGRSSYRGHQFNRGSFRDRRSNFSFENYNRDSSSPEDDLRASDNYPLTDDWPIVDNSETLKPVDNSEILEAVDNSEILQPVDNSEILQPVDNSDILQPVDNSGILQPVDNSILEPVENASRHDQSPAYARNFKTRNSFDHRFNKDSFRGRRGKVYSKYYDQNFHKRNSGSPSGNPQGSENDATDEWSNNDNGVSLQLGGSATADPRQRNIETHNSWERQSNRDFSKAPRGKFFNKNHDRNSRKRDGSSPESKLQVDRINDHVPNEWSSNDNISSQPVVNDTEQCQNDSDSKNIDANNSWVETVSSEIPDQEECAEAESTQHFKHKNLPGRSRGPMNRYNRRGLPGRGHSRSGKFVYSKSKEYGENTTAINTSKNSSSNSSDSRNQTGQDATQPWRKSRSFGDQSKAFARRTTTTRESFNEDNMIENFSRIDLLRNAELEKRFKMSAGDKTTTKQDEEPIDHTIARERLKKSDNENSITGKRKIVGGSKARHSDEGHNNRFKSVWDTPNLIDPRMERERLNKSDNLITTSHQATVGSKTRRSDERYKNSRVVSYFDGHNDDKTTSEDFELWSKNWEEVKEFKVVEEIEADLFDQPKDYSLAHCVAEDLRMGSGIAVAFKREFKSLPDLLDQRAKQGGLATLHDEEHGRFIYYLVTKRESSAKPNYYNLWRSLCMMKEHIKEHEVKKMAIPRLACGLDRLEWDKVKTMIEWLFKDLDIAFTVCNFQQNYGKAKKKVDTNKSEDNKKTKKKSSKK